MQDMKANETTVGMDLSDRSSSLCVLDHHGTITHELKVPTSRDALSRWFDGRPRCRVVMEACRQSSWIARLLRGFGHEVLVANPRQLHLISKSTRKSDRNDARLLARLGRVDPQLLCPVHVRTEASLAVKTLINARQGLVRTRTHLINLVRGSVKTFGYTVAPCSSEAFHRSRLPAPLKTALEPLMRALEAVTEQIRDYDAQVKRIGEQQYPQTELFRQVHGVGPLVALAFTAVIEDPTRFPRSRDVGPYLGLTPRTYQSGETDPRLRISKQGDGTMRSLLVTAATHILRRSAPDTDLKRYGRRLAKSGTPRDKARARVAVARKLAVVLHRIWLTGEVYEPLRQTR